MSDMIEAGGEDLAAKRAAFEAEKMNRRQALRRFGFRAAGAALAAFTVDDLARAVMNRMEKVEAMRGITDGVAKEFRNAGFAFGEAMSSSACKGCGSCPDPLPPGKICVDCGDCPEGGQKVVDCEKIVEYVPAEES